MMNTHLVLPAILPSPMAMALPVPTDVLLLDAEADDEGQRTSES